MTVLVNVGRVIGLGMLFALAGCGSGGGGGVNGAPAVPSSPASTAPTPVIPAGLSPSTSFTNKMQSGNFATIRAGVDVTRDNFAPSGTLPKITVETADPNAFISYDAANNLYALGYTNTSGVASKIEIHATSSVTGPVSYRSVIANGDPDPTEVYYYNNDCYTSGCYGASYKISHKAASGFVYSYTAFGYTNSYGDSFIGGGGGTTANSFVFGIATPTSAIPRTGSATYALDLVGLIGSRSEIAGNGSGTVNFGSGTYNFTGNVTPPGPVTNGVQISGTFQSSGTLSGAGNGFSGNVNLAVTSTNSTANQVQNYAYSGTVGGMFFGPNAQELGGTFVAPATSGGGIAYGAILGHR